MRKLSYNYVKDALKSMGYNLLSNDFPGTKPPILFSDKEGYKYFLPFGSLIDCRGNRTPERFSKLNSYTIHNISLWLEKNSSIRLKPNQKYLGNSGKLLFYCPNCKKGEIPFTSSWDKIFAGRGCGICRGLQVGKYNSLQYLFPEIAKQWDKKRNGELTPKDVTKGSGKKVYWICPDCKEFYIANIRDRTGRGNSCPICSSSKGEIKIRNWLTKNKIRFEREHRFSDCGNKRPFPFDFYIPHLNMLIEYQGLHHYEPFRYFGGDADFKIRKKRDLVKKKYATKNEFNFLEIKFTDFDNIEKILEREVKT